jgi:putative ATPase
MVIPLYEQLRPTAFSEISGQEHLQTFFKTMVQSKKPVSLLLAGPPGCGKTTIARLYAQSFSLPFVTMTGVLQSTAELKKILREGEAHPLFRRQIILFFDEIHRLNRAQQDIFLPFLEDGSLILIGATTENPSYVLNGALLSRLRVLTLKAHSIESLNQILLRYESKNKPLPITPEARQFILSAAQGDARHLLNFVETIERLPSQTYDEKSLAELIHRRQALYDKDRDGHYNLISALHKSVRGSDPDAAIYWLCRMLEGGEDPLFIGRRLIRMASEDVGLADPQALPQAIAAYQTYELLGSPEGELALAQAAIYLALAPKSNALYTAYGATRKTAAETGHLNPPKTIVHQNDGYIYDHDTPEGFSGQNYFPEGMARLSIYSPVERGFEREMAKRLAYFAHLRQKKPKTFLKPL